MLLNSAWDRTRGDRRWPRTSPFAPITSWSCGPTLQRLARYIIVGACVLGLAYVGDARANSLDTSQCFQEMKDQGFIAPPVSGKVGTYSLGWGGTFPKDCEIDYGAEQNGHVYLQMLDSGEDAYSFNARVRFLWSPVTGEVQDITHTTPHTPGRIPTIIMGNANNIKTNYGFSVPGGDFIGSGAKALTITFGLYGSGRCNVIYNTGMYIRNSNGRIFSYLGIKKIDPTPETISQPFPSPTCSDYPSKDVTVNYSEFTTEYPYMLEDGTLLIVDSGSDFNPHNAYIHLDRDFRQHTTLHGMYFIIPSVCLMPELDRVGDDNIRRQEVIAHAATLTEQSISKFHIFEGECK